MIRYVLGISLCGRVIHDYQLDIWPIFGPRAHKSTFFMGFKTYFRSLNMYTKLIAFSCFGPQNDQ